MDAQDSSSPEYLVNQSSLTCLTVIKGAGIHDAVIGMSKLSGGVKQQWIPKNGQWYWGGNRSLCLSKNESGELCLAPYNPRRWIHDQEGRLTLGNLALDVPWQNPRKQVLLYPKHSHLNQKWWTLSQLNECLDDCQMTAEHCLAPTIVDICKKEINRVTSEKVTNPNQKKDCKCQAGNSVARISGMKEVGFAASDTTKPDFLISQSTFTCLSVISGTKPSDAIIGLSPFSGSLNQQWIVKNNQWLWAKDPSYSLIPDWEQSLLKLGVASISNASWIFSDQGLLETDSMVLDVPWETPRTQVIVYPKHGGENQRWWRLSDVKNSMQKPYKCTTSYPEKLKKMVEIIPEVKEKTYCNCLEKNPLNSSGVFGEPDYLISQSTHTCLTVLGSTSPGNATIGLEPYIGSTNQQWYHKDGICLWGGDPNYCLAPDKQNMSLCLVPKDKENVLWSMDKSGMFINGSQTLDVPWEGKRTKVLLYPKHGGINQKWWFLSKLKLCIGQKMYPFPTNNERAYKEEIARGLVNRLCPLADPLPHPRDITCYPGTVSPTTPRVEMSCLLKVGEVKQVNNLRITVPQDWQATNIYVAAGDIFTVTLPDTLTEAQAEQITVRVGAQCDSLNPTSPNLENGTFKRMPIVSEEFDVEPGVNSLRSQFGGNLIFTYEGEKSFEVTAFVKNVIETPHYMLGKSSKSDWNRMKHLGAPFSVLETSKVVLIVPTSKARDISDLDNLLHRYDDIISRLEDLSGFTEEDPPPQGKQWLVDDVQITAGSAHAGFPVMFDNKYYDLTSLETPHDWVVWHELGHNYQQGEYWSYAYGSESTVNLFSLYIQENLKSDDRLKRENRYAPTIKAVDEGLTFEKADCWQKLVFLMEIKHAFPSHGWNMYRHLNKSVRSLSEHEAKLLRSSQQKQYDYVYYILSLYVGFDLLPHYQRWSLPLSKEVQNEINLLGLPKASKNLLATCQPDKCVIT